MAEMKRILFYTNQFFGQIGGEEFAYQTPFVEEGTRGNANAFAPSIKGGEIVATIVCGDNYFVENMEVCLEFIKEQVEQWKPDILIAGPAFNAGRFGIACCEVCKFVQATYGIPSITGLYWENPGVEMYKADCYIMEVGKSAATETQNPEYPITLMSCRMLYHYHTRTQTNRTRAVYYTAPRNFIELNADDCAEKKLTDGDWVQVTSPRGSVFCEVHVTDKLEPGVAWMPFHFGDGANILSDAKNLDPIAKIPGFKQIGIKVEKASPEVSQYLTRQAQADALEYYKNEGPETIRHKERAMEDLLKGQM